MSARWMMIAILGWSGVALAEDLIVIDVSNGAGIAVGDVIADGKAIELPAGAKATLIGASGKTVPLNGPYKGVPGAGTDKGDGRLMVALTSLVQGRSDGTAKVGAVRAGYWRLPLAKTTTDVYVLDGSLIGDQCITQAHIGKVPFVYDPEKRDKSAEAITLLSAEAGTAGTMNAAGAAKGVPWPSNLPLGDGNTYLVEVPGQSGLNQFTVKVLAGTPGNEVQQAVQLLQAGCKQQAEMMIEVVKKAAQ